MNTRNTILNSLNNINERLEVLEEWDFDAKISSSEKREIEKRRKKLLKNKKKLLKKLEQFKFNPDYNTLD
jgi:hypothetical protein